MRKPETAPEAVADAATATRNCHVPAAGGFKVTVTVPAEDVLPLVALVNGEVPARRYCTVTLRVAAGEMVSAACN